jgi:hypothetical protein
MRKRSDNFELALLGLGIALVFLFKTIYEGLFYSWTLRLLQRHLNLSEAEVIAKFSEIALPTIVAKGTIWALYRYIHMNLRRELQAEIDRRPRLKLSFATDRVLNYADGSIQTFFRITNEETNTVEGVEVKFEEATLMRSGSDKWEKTSIIAKPNMSWCSLPDANPQKYAAIQLAPGGSCWISSKVHTAHRTIARGSW